MLEFIEKVTNRIDKKHGYSLYRCHCGKTKEIRNHHVNKGISTSCGCYQKSRLKEAALIHGMRFSREYRSWQSMKQRCLNPNHIAYASYGGRGITIHTPWIDSFENFYKDMGDRPEGYSIDRINNNDGYKPDNCKWSTHKEQSNNTRKSRIR